MTEILLIRHPETDLAGTFCGHSDPPINAAGEAQMRHLLTTLANDQLDTVYTSDMQRAQTLARTLAEAHQATCISRPALREIHFGNWEALTWAHIERNHPEQAAAWLASFPHHPAPNGERFDDFQARVLHEFDRILSEPRQRVAIVTHGGVLRTILTLRATLDEQTAWALTQPYCSSIRYTPTVATMPQTKVEPW